MKGNQNWYWSTRENDLVIAYQNAKDDHERNRIYLELRPKIRKMAESILSRYFGGNIKHSNFDDLVSESESVLPKALLKFDSTSNFKSFSYLQTCIRNYFYDRYVNGKDAEYNRSISIDDFMDGAERQEHLESFMSSDVSGLELEEIYQDVKQRAIDHLQGLIKKKKRMLSYGELINNTETTKKEIQILGIMQDFISEHEDYNRYHITYYMLKRTGFTIARLCRYLYLNNLQGILIRKYNIEFYEKKIADYVERYGKTGDYIKQALSVKNVKEVPESTLYKVQEKNKNAGRKPKKNYSK